MDNEQNSLKSSFLVSAPQNWRGRSYTVWQPLVRKTSCGILLCSSLVSFCCWTCSNMTPVWCAAGKMYCSDYQGVSPVSWRLLWHLHWNWSSWWAFQKSLLSLLAPVVFTCCPSSEKHRRWYYYLPQSDKTSAAWFCTCRKTRVSWEGTSGSNLSYLQGISVSTPVQLTVQNKLYHTSIICL